MSLIKKIVAREILDSRGNPTVEVDVILDTGEQGRFGVPSGASTGAHEAHEVRDGGSRFLGKGVQTVVANVNNQVAPELIGQEVTQQKIIDRRLIDLDGTANKKNLGANALLGVSMACARAASESLKTPFFQYLGGVNACRLPVPLMNVLNGGAHADNGLDVQEFMIVPNLGGCFSESLRAGSEVFHNLKKILAEKNLSTAVGDEGGFAPHLKSNIAALELLTLAIEKAGYKPGEEVSLALDVAATELFKEGQYNWEGRLISGDELGEVYRNWKNNFPLISIEDGFSEDDWDMWIKFNSEINNKARSEERLQLVGDDLFVTNTQRLKKGIDSGAANALLVKVNQIGTLTEAIEAVSMAHKANFKTVMSHRSGETEDTSIADLSVALDCFQIKTGGLCRSERIAKYNQLLRIEEFLGTSAVFG